MLRCSFSLRNRDLLVAACWAAIIPLALGIFYCAATGWAQWSYRYGLDFTPFLWLLVARQIGDNLKPWHVALIVAAVAVNVVKEDARRLDWMKRAIHKTGRKRVLEFARRNQRER